MKIKKSLFTVYLTFITSIAVFAQFANCEVADIEKLKQSEVIVAISDDEENNKAIEEVMTSNWTASKYRVIKLSELDSYLKSNPKNFIISFLRNQKVRKYRQTITISKRTITHPNQPVYQKIDNPIGNATYRRYKDVLLLSSNLKSTKGLNLETAMFTCLIDSELELADETAEFIREIAIMNSILILPDLTDKKLKKIKMFFNYPTANPKMVIDKELWIADSDVDIKDETKMKSVYPYKFKIVTKAEIADAIHSKRKDIVYIAYILARETSFDIVGPLIKSDIREDGYYLFQNAEDNRILTLIDARKKFDHRYLEYILKAVDKSK